MSALLRPLVRRGEGVVPDSTMSRLVQQGAMVPVLPGTWLRADLVAIPGWRAAAACAWRPDAVVTGDAAAALTFWSERSVPVVEVACRTEIRRPGFRFVRRSIPGDLMRWQGATCLTAPALTAIDLAPITDGESIDTVLRSKTVRIKDLHAALEATRYRRGNRDRRRLLLDSRAEPWSVAERIAHRLLRTAGIEGWRANRPIVLRRQLFYLDIAFGAIRLVIEIDGRAFHSGPDVFESDRVRQNALTTDGWTVLRFTYRMLADDPGYVLATVRDGIELASRRRRLGC